MAQSCAAGGLAGEGPTSIREESSPTIMITESKTKAEVKMKMNEKAVVGTDSDSSLAWCPPPSSPPPQSSPSRRKVTLSKWHSPSMPSGPREKRTSQRPISEAKGIFLGHKQQLEQQLKEQQHLSQVKEKEEDCNLLDTILPGEASRWVKGLPVASGAVTDNEIPFESSDACEASAATSINSSISFVEPSSTLYSVGSPLPSPPLPMTNTRVPPPSSRSRKDSDLSLTWFEDTMLLGDHNLNFESTEGLGEEEDDDDDDDAEGLVKVREGEEEEKETKMSARGRDRMRASILKASYSSSIHGNLEALGACAQGQDSSTSAVRFSSSHPGMREDVVQQRGVGGVGGVGGGSGGSDGSDKEEELSALLPTPGAHERSTTLLGMVKGCMRSVLSGLPLAQEALPRVHAGFWWAYESVREDVIVSVAAAIFEDTMARELNRQTKRSLGDAVYDQDEPSSDGLSDIDISLHGCSDYSSTNGLSQLEICISGHSLGGALAVLAATDISVNLSGILRAVGALVADVCQGQRFAHSGLRPVYPVNWPSLTCYTFGAPPIGNHAFAARVSRRVPTCYRVEVDGDIISQNFFSWMLSAFYAHCGYQVIVDREAVGNLLVDPTFVETVLLQSMRDKKMSYHTLDKYRACMEACLHPDEHREYLQTQESLREKVKAVELAERLGVGSNSSPFNFQQHFQGLSGFTSYYRREMPAWAFSQG